MPENNVFRSQHNFSEIDRYVDTMLLAVPHMTV